MNHPSVRNERTIVTYRMVKDTAFMMYEERLMIESGTEKVIVVQERHPENHHHSSESDYFADKAAFNSDG